MGCGFFLPAQLGGYELKGIQYGGWALEEYEGRRGNSLFFLFLFFSPLLDFRSCMGFQAGGRTSHCRCFVCQ